jgi:DNA-binding HxlR family transcriptional regulator
MRPFVRTTTGPWSSSATGGPAPCCASSWPAGTRFGEIKAAVPGLSDRLLARRLKELETEGILTRTVVPDTPVRIEYHLTAKGQALGAVVDALGEWADRWLAHHARSRRRRPVVQ